MKAHHQLTDLARQILAIDRYEPFGPAKVLARAILTLDNPEHFVTLMGCPQATPERSVRSSNISPYRDRKADADL